MRAAPTGVVARVVPSGAKRSSDEQGQGAGNDLLAQAMGHVDSRMVERVYGRMTSDDLARLLTARTSGAGRGETLLPDGNPLHALPPGGGSEEPGTSVGRLMADVPDKQGPPSTISENALDALTALFADDSAGFAVPRDGIEPPTRGFSIPCSTN